MADRVHVRVANELRASARAVLDPRFDPPHATSRARRMAHGAGLPFKVLRGLLRDHDARRHYLRLLAIEVALVVPIAIVVALNSDAIGEAAEGGHGWRALVGETWAFLGELYVTLCVVEWMAIWIAREHHDALAFRASVLTHVPGEPLAGPPRVRFDLAFLWLKAKRKLRAAILVALGLPFFWVFTLVPGVGHVLYALLEGVWAAYWAGVFAIANTHLAWENEGRARAPWFERTLEQAALVPVAGVPALLLLPLVRRVTHSVRPACEAFEEAPWESLGLALARLLLSAPVVWIAVRPVFGPASTHALLGARYADEEALKSNGQPASLPGRSP